MVATVCNSLASQASLFASTQLVVLFFFFFSSRRRHTRSKRDWSSDVCSSDLLVAIFWMFQVDQVSRPELLSGMLVVDPLTQLVKQALLVLTVATGLVSLDSRFKIGRASCRERV